jgi:hypothetical protein
MEVTVRERAEEEEEEEGRRGISRTVREEEEATGERTSDRGTSSSLSWSWRWGWGLERGVEKSCNWRCFRFFASLLFFLSDFESAGVRGKRD